MSESLWNDIDAYLETAFLTDLGEDSDYATVVVAEVHNTAEWTPGKWALPAVAFNGNEADSEYGAQHDGFPHEHPTYAYVVSGVVKEASDATARANAKILLARLRESLRTRFALDGLDPSSISADGSGESIVETRVPSWAVYVFPVENTKLWYGVARIALDVVTEL